MPKKKVKLQASFPFTLNIRYFDRSALVRYCHLGVQKTEERSKQEFHVRDIVARPHTAGHSPTSSGCSQRIRRVVYHLSCQGNKQVPSLRDSMFTFTQTHTVMAVHKITSPSATTHRALVARMSIVTRMVTVCIQIAAKVH